MKPNKNYKKLESSYLFYDIEQRVKAYSAELKESVEKKDAHLQEAGYQNY